MQFLKFFLVLLFACEIKCSLKLLIPYTFQNFIDTRGLPARKPNSSYTCYCLHIASVYGHTETIELLLKQHGVDKDIKDSTGCTPLWHAPSNDQQNAVKLLLNARADVNVPNIFGKTPMHRAIYLGFNTFVLVMAVKSGKIAMLEMLLNYDFTFEERYEALQAAIKDGKSEAVNILLNTAHHGDDFSAALFDPILSLQGEMFL